MSKKLVCMLVGAMLALTLLAGCGKKEAATDQATAETEAADQATAEPAEAVEPAAEEPVQMVNPWRECDASEIEKMTGTDMLSYPGATDVVYQINESDQLGEMQFKDEVGSDFCYRVKKTDALEDISGMYYDWTSEDDSELFGLPGKSLYYDGDGEDAQVLIWYDPAMQLTYSLSVAGDDLDGLDLYGMALRMYLPEDFVEEFMPGNMVEDKAQKYDFADFDEVIGYLDPGCGYTTARIYGLDEEVLIVTDEVFDNGDGVMAALTGYVFAHEDGVVRSIGSFFSDGTAYPISIDGEGKIYSGNGHEVEVSCVAAETGGVMDMVFAYEAFDENGNATYGGFIRENNNVMEDGKQIAEDDGTVLPKLFEDYSKAKPLNFTIVK